MSIFCWPAPSSACSGEVIWMRRILDKYHEAAKEKNVRIVHCCGFDSIPSDLGTCLVVDHLNSLGKYVLHACAFVLVCILYLIAMQLYPSSSTAPGICCAMGHIHCNNILLPCQHVCFAMCHGSVRAGGSMALLLHDSMSLLCPASVAAVNHHPLAQCSSLQAICSSLQLQGGQ